jgi:hypothetical protein
MGSESDIPHFVDTARDWASLAPPTPFLRNDGSTERVAESTTGELNRDQAQMYATLDERDQRVLNNWRTQVRCCIFCQKYYREIDNLGQWKCSQYVTDIINDAYTNDPIVLSPLIRADHRWEYNPMRWTAAENQVLSQALTDYLTAGGHLNAMSIIEATQGQNCVGISRFDWRAVDSFRKACIYYTPQSTTYERFHPFHRVCGPLLQRNHTSLPLHDLMYGKMTEESVIRRVPYAQFKRTISSVPNNERAVKLRLQMRSQQLARANWRQNRAVR